jgi:hypothetical protein
MRIYIAFLNLIRSSSNFEFISAQKQISKKQKVKETLNFEFFSHTPIEM